LHLASASNFRDVGGYRTEEGRWVRMGVAFRSNALAALTDAERASVAGLGPRVIFDMRLQEERNRMPDPEIAGSRVVAADVAADSGHRMPALRALMRSGDDTAVANFMHGAYRDFVDLPSARAAYRQLLEQLADPASLPMVFHCTAGKDRTGWAQAILLSILRVPRSAILQDYALTDRFMSDGALEQIRRSLPEADVVMSRALVAADSAYLETAFREVDERYGSFDGYLDQGLGVDARTVTAIRANFLTK
jgi:protein-tyrosine phosphatase